MTLIKSVLNSIPIYTLSFYKPPKSAIQEIIRSQRDFLWDGISMKRKMEWISWLSVCKLMSEDGLGIKHCERFNLSLLSKWKWHILDKPKVIWYDLLSMRYGDIKAETLEVKRQLLNKSDSLWWRNLSLVSFT